MQSNQFEQEDGIRCRQLPFNPQQTLRLQSDPLYVRFKQWLKQKGVLIDPRVRYPCYFGPKNRGIIGVGVSKAIQRKRAIIAIPYSLCITVDSVMMDKRFQKIIQDNMVVFLKSRDSSIRILTLFLSFQLLKGNQSQYAPYFNIANQSFLSQWSRQSRNMLENKQLSQKIRQEQQKIQKIFMDFLRIYRTYQHIFPSSLTNQQYYDIFIRAYNFIATRAYGWSVPSISLIPLADSLNHSNIRYLNHFVSNIERQKDIHKNGIEGGYRDNVNISILKDQFFVLTQQQLAVLRQPRKTRVQQFVQKHQEILKQREKVKNNKKPTQRQEQFHILHQQYRAGIHKLKDLHFYDSSCSEDNDTDEDQVFDKVLQQQKFQLQDRGRNIKEGSRLKEVQKYWKYFYDQQASSNQSQQQSKQSQPKSKQQKQRAQQLKKNLENQLNGDNKSSSAQSSQSDQPQQQFQWFFKQEYSNKNTYFLMNTKQLVRENQQIYNFYGRRSNQFLLTGYNFILQDNVYDSFGIRLKLDSRLTSPVPGAKLIAKYTKEGVDQLGSRKLKLKRNRIHMGVIKLCRSYIILWSKKQLQNCSICIPFDRQIEQKTLQLYQDIIKSSLKAYSTSIEEDQQTIQEQKLTREERIALGIRIEHKKILKGQEKLVGRCMIFLKNWKVGAVQNFQQGQMRWVKRIREYLNALQQAKSL